MKEEIFYGGLVNMETIFDQTDASRQLAKYKPRLKAQCILKAISGIFALLMIILLFFIPFFEIKSTDELGDVTNKLFGTFTFSVFDDATHAIKLLSDGQLFEMNATSPMSALFGTFALFQLVAFLFLFVGVALIAIDIGKDISKLPNIDNYVLETYDNMKSKRDETVKQLKRLNTMGWRFLMVGAIYEIIMIVFLKFTANFAGAHGVGLAQLLTDPSFLTGENPYTGITSYFMLVNSITPSIIPVILCALCAFITLIVQRKLGEQVKMDILKDDYHLGKRNEPTAYPAYPTVKSPYYPPYQGQPQQPYQGQPYPMQPQQPYQGQPYMQTPYGQPSPVGRQNREQAEVSSEKPSDRRAATEKTENPS